MHTPQAVRRGPLSDSELLQVTYGCPWAKCLFCNLYEHEEFGVVPMAHICLPQPRKKFLPQSQS